MDPKDLDSDDEMSEEEEEEEEDDDGSSDDGMVPVDEDAGVSGSNTASNSDGDQGGEDTFSEGEKKFARFVLHLNSDKGYGHMKLPSKLALKEQYKQVSPEGWKDSHVDMIPDLNQLCTCTHRPHHHCATPQPERPAHHRTVVSPQEHSRAGEQAGHSSATHRRVHE